MIFVVFGLSISSAWGNGHATLLRGLFRALNAEGHKIHFFEQDVPYYARHRDAIKFPYAHLHLYREWSEVEGKAKRLLRESDVGMVTSYCPHGNVASHLILDSKMPRSVFYDMDTPVTLQRLARGETVDYLPDGGLAGFDLVLSYTGGHALHDLRKMLGASLTAPLYGWVDPDVHARQPSSQEFASDLAYLGTYAADRHAALRKFLLEPARCLPECRFLIAGAMYDDQADWPSNVRVLEHVAPPEHGQFYSSSPLMLSITRESMAQTGYCPSGRLFESAACGTAVLSDWWEGLDFFFTPQEEILIAHSKEDAMRAIRQDPGLLRQIGARARERVLDCHTAGLRARTLMNLLEQSAAGKLELAQEPVASGLV